MIASDKVKNALYALNAVLVYARTMAFERANHEDIAQVLDVAELLPMLIAEKGDATNQFRSQLEALVNMNEASVSRSNVSMGSTGYRSRSCLEELEAQK